MTREQMIDRLVQNDINDIEQGLSQTMQDTEFLEAVLRGEGWTGYNNLTDEEIVAEYKAREFEEAV